MKRFSSFIIPGGILFFASLIMIHMDRISASLPAILSVYPYVVFASSVLIGWRFNRSSLVFAAIVLAIADRSILIFCSDYAASGVTGKIVFNAVSFLLPINLAALCLAKERGVVTVHGIIRIFVIMLQPVLIAIFVKVRPAALLSWLGHPFYDWKLFEKTIFTQPALAAIFIAFVIIGVRFIRNKGAKESGFFWVLITCLAGLSHSLGSESVFYFSTAGFILLVSIIEASYAMAFRDELTGLPARRALKEDLLKLGNHYTLAMLDIDHFKKFNDRHGHDVGDQVLRMVASKLSDVSGGGKAYRYGGEEFTVVFTGRYSDDAQYHLEELRKDVESSGFAIRGRMRPLKKPRKPKKGKKPSKRVSVTVSIGMAGRDGNNTKPHEVLKAADKALYRAKKSGRNRLVV
jgi:diguanylate cyclase (GGDEF)-like protein